MEPDCIVPKMWFVVEVEELMWKGDEEEGAIDSGSVLLKVLV